LRGLVRASAATEENESVDFEAIKSTLHTGTIADVLDAKGIWGVLPSALQRVSGHRRAFAGRAVTINWRWVRKSANIKEVQRSSWSQVEAFLLRGVRDAKGLVYVAGSSQGLVTDFALAGGLSATHFQNIGFEALVLGGGVRDAHVLRGLEMPIVASGLTPADTQGCYEASETGASCMVGNVHVRSGDIVFGDETGIVVIPAAVADEVIARAFAIEKEEDAVVRRLGAGHALAQIIDDGGRV
jgi:regulator of RNase E activity RraA